MHYAILYSGMTVRRNLNGLELCYRALVDHCGFEARNIQVLNFDGSLNATDGRPDTAWPGDGCAFRLQVTGEGTRDGFRAALATLKQQLTSDDLLFIHTSGHGGDYGDGRGPFLVAYPRRHRYRMHDFCSDLAGLPPHRALVVLMTQCFSTGFGPHIVAASPSRQTFVAAASSGYSYAMQDDRSWSSFERNCIAALAGRTVREAFDHANTPEVRDPRESSECFASSAMAERVTLGIRAPLPARPAGVEFGSPIR